MRQTRRLVGAVVVFVASLSAFSAYAKSTPAARDRQGAQLWLNKIQTAAKQLSYSGTFIYQQANQVRTSRITHMLNGRNELEKLEILDGKPREYIRNNNEIVYYVPDTKTLLVEKRVAQDVFPAMLNANPAKLTDFYNVRKGGTGRVAGYPAQAIILEPKDNLRYGYKLWAERKSGLLLRAQTLNEKHEVVEQISFTEIAIGGIHRNQVRPSFTNTQGWHVENAVMRMVNLSGWTIKGMPPGFKKIREVRRMVSDTPAPVHGVAPSSREVSQIVYSDGLAAISIFIEPGNINRAEGHMQQGAVNILGKRQGDFWLTIVGEVPSVAIKRVANSIEFNTR